MSISFFPAAFYPTGSSPYGIATADFNGDSKLDLAIPSINDGEVAVLLGNGDGTFQAAQFIPVASYAAGIISADFNSDGNIDLAVTNTYSNNVAILINSMSKPMRGILFFY